MAHALDFIFQVTIFQIKTFSESVIFEDLKRSVLNMLNIQIDSMYVLLID